MIETNFFPQQIRELVSELRKWPGIGEKTALRLSLYLSRFSEGQLDRFSSTVTNLKTLECCKSCGLFAEPEGCLVCGNIKRAETRQLCVVEGPLDYIAIEGTGSFNGLYHVLGGVLNPLLGIGPEELNLDGLFQRILDLEIKTIILALNPSLEGDATCSYIREELGEDLEIRKLGVGIPVGGALEYLDPITIGKALENGQCL